MNTPKKHTEQDYELLTIVLHDIQSPLRFISTITEDLANNCLVMDKETLLEHASMLNNAVMSLQHYCNKIYAWKKEANLFDLNHRININEIFTNITKIYAPLIEAKKIKFNMIETDLYCFSKVEILFIIIINLIDNAYKYTDAGSITLEAIIIDNEISIIVSDTGKGMQKEKIDDILEDRIKLKGSSLGYYIIKDLLKKINGTLLINSQINFGTQVIVNLLNPEKYDNAYQDS